MSDYSGIERPWVRKFDNTDRASSLGDRDNLGISVRCVCVARFIRYVSIWEVAEQPGYVYTGVRISFRVGRPLVNCGCRIRILPGVACLYDKLLRESGLEARVSRVRRDWQRRSRQAGRQAG